MITLSLVSTSGLYKDLEHDKFHYNDGNATRVIELLEQNSIKNYDQLAKLLNSGAISDDYAYSYLARKLNYISDRIRKANAKNMQYEIFTFPETLGDEVDAETLRITDEKSLGKVLLCPYINPISYMGYAHGGTKWPHIKGRSVSNIKELLGALNKDTLGNEISSCRKMGKKSTQQLVTAIGLYHEQILRQAQVTQERGIDLFSYQHMEKIRGVEEFFPTVVEQLIETTTATI